MSILTRIYSGSCINGDTYYFWLEFYDYLQTAEDEVMELLEREKIAIERDIQKLIDLSGIIWSKVQPIPAHKDEIDLMVNANQKLLQLNKQKTRHLHVYKVSNRK